MDKKVIVFDFDKTLTNYDTILPFFLFCCRKNVIRYLLIPLYLLIKILSKFGLISVKIEKEIGLIFFCPKNIHDFHLMCIEFSKTVELNQIFNDIYAKILKLKVHILIIVSGSFQHYLDEIFPNILVIGTTLKLDKKNNIIGIDDHPFKYEKVELLKKNGINSIDIFYTDSKNDIPITNFAKKTNWINKGEIVHRN